MDFSDSNKLEPFYSRFVQSGFLMWLKFRASAVFLIINSGYSVSIFWGENHITGAKSKPSRSTERFFEIFLNTRADTKKCAQPYGFH